MSKTIDRVGTHLDRMKTVKCDNVSSEKSIFIKTSKNADTRSCDYPNISKAQLLKSTVQHIDDVRKGLDYITSVIKGAGCNHDHTKLSGINEFHAEFITGFKTQEWLDMHVEKERHHLVKNVPDDVDLIDIIEFLVDCVMAAMGRSGVYYKQKLPEGLLEKAFDNTVDRLIKSIEVEEK